MEIISFFFIRGSNPAFQMLASTTHSSGTAPNSGLMITNAMDIIFDCGFIRLKYYVLQVRLKFEMKDREVCARWFCDVSLSRSLVVSLIVEAQLFFSSSEPLCAAAKRELPCMSLLVWIPSSAPFSSIILACDDPIDTTQLNTPPNK